MCSWMNIRELGPIAYRQPVLFSTHEIVLEHTPLLFECQKCESWFTQYIVPEVLALEMYQSGASKEKWVDTPSLSDGKSANIIARLDQYIHNGTTVLDVGANTGELLDYARSRGALTFGVEPSNASQEVIAGKGHKVFASMEKVSDAFDVITAFDLVEHLHDLPGFMRWAHDRLKVGGVLILLTGDNHCLSARLSRQRWWYLKAPEHIVFPSELFFVRTEGFLRLSKDITFASCGYQKTRLMQYLQYVRKSVFSGGYDGLPSLGPDHMLLTLSKTE